MADYSFDKELDMDYDEAMDRIIDELSKEGFGILTDIDVKATLKDKLGVDFKQYHILGACNPNYAYEGLQEDEQVGLLLPCKVIVYEKNGKVIVSAQNPVEFMSLINEELCGMANEVKKKLRDVIQRL
jgi:uncharacterized protein (DUF302 family)